MGAPSAQAPLPVDEDAVGDQWMLCLLLVLWVAFIIIMCMRSRREIVTSAGQRLPRRLQQKVLQRKWAYSLFIYEALPPDCVHLTVSKHRPRSFESFRKGEAPKLPDFQFQAAFRFAQRWDIYRALMSGAITSCWPFIVFCGLIALMLSWININGPALSRKIGIEFFDEKYTSSNFKACAEIQKMLLPLASFSVALILNGKVAWYNDVISKSWSVQDSLHRIGSIISMSLSDTREVSIQRAKYTIHRYCNLFHFFLYQSIALDYLEVRLEDLIETRLLTRDEADALDRVASKKNAVLLWLTSVLKQLVRDGHIDNEAFTQVLLPKINELSCTADLIVNEMVRRPPMSFVQVLQIMVDLLLLLTPPATVYSLRFEGVKHSITVYLWPLLCSMTVALFYQGALHVIASIGKPFSISADNLRPDFVLMTTEHTLFEALTQVLPQSIQDKHWERGIPTTAHELHQLSSKTLTVAEHDDSSDLTGKIQASVEHAGGSDVSFTTVLPVGPPGAVQD